MTWFLVRADRHVRWQDKLNPVWWFGNINEPQPPAWYEQTLPQWRRYLGWYTRNLGHNFNWYVIGFADRDFWRLGRYPQHNWALPPARWNWAWPPFVSYNGKHIEWQIGWKDQGNFGAALRRTTTTP